MRAEITQARRYFARNNWPVIDVTRRSIEETSAAIMTIYNRRMEEAERPLVKEDDGDG